MTPQEFLFQLMVFCYINAASVTSYGRTLFHNSKEHGVAHSAHLAWVGADVVYDGLTNEQEVKEWAARLDLALIRERDHDHLQPLGWKPG